jgi:adenylate cyclase
MELAQNARLLANVQLKPDTDGIYRRSSLFSFFDDKTVPSLALATYLSGDTKDHEVEIKRGSLVLDGYALPIDEGGFTIMRFRGPSGTHPTYSAAAVIQSELRILEGETPVIDPALFEDRYVFFGFSAPGLMDLRSSPVGGVYPGVEIHATMLDNLLSRDFMRNVPRVSSFLLIALAAILAGVVASSVSGAVGNAIVYAGFLPLAPVLSLLFFVNGYWLPLMAIEIAVVVTLIGAGLVNYATEGRQKRYIKGAFKQYLSPAVIEELIAHPERLKLGGERRELSIFFSDLQGFTGISEGLSPEELTALLNDYLSAMTDIIQDEGGTVDKYEGDAIIAFWNAPIDQEDHAIRSVRAALRCQQTLSGMRPAIRQQIGKDLFMRIGINTGPAVVGNMGSHTRFDYTMLGDAVNLAARLEGINKQFKTYTMISKDTKDRLENSFAVRELSRVAVVGRKEAVVVYEPMLDEDYEKSRELLPTFSKALEAFYEGRFAEAERQFARIAENDPAASCYVQKCRELMENPPEMWEGVWVMTSK